MQKPVLSKSPAREFNRNARQDPSYSNDNASNFRVVDARAEYSTKSAQVSSRNKNYELELRKHSLAAVTAFLTVLATLIGSALLYQMHRERMYFDGSQNSLQRASTESIEKQKLQFEYKKLDFERDKAEKSRVTASDTLKMEKQKLIFQKDEGERNRRHNLRLKYIEAIAKNRKVEYRKKLNRHSVAILDAHTAPRAVKLKRSSKFGLLTDASSGSASNDILHLKNLVQQESTNRCRSNGAGHHVRVHPPCPSGQAKWPPRDRKTRGRAIVF